MSQRLQNMVGTRHKINIATNIVLMMVTNSRLKGVDRTYSTNISNSFEDRYIIPPMLVNELLSVFCIPYGMMRHIFPNYANHDI